VTQIPRLEISHHVGIESGYEPFHNLISCERFAGIVEHVIDPQNELRGAIGGSIPTLPDTPIG